MIRRTLTILTALAVLFSATAGVSAQGPREGISVRGHWLLEVQNPDGTIAATREFDNHLESGAFTLVALLTRTASMGRWAIHLETEHGFEVPDNPFGNSAQVYMTEPNANVPSDIEIFKNLTVTSSGSLNQAPTVTLKGTATALRKGFITHVHSVLSSCSPTVVADTCNPAGLAAYLPFTGKRLENAAGAAPLEIEAEQSVRVTVTISFASATNVISER